MEFSTISNEQKRVIAEASLGSIETELLRELIQSGINPTDFVDISEIENSENPDIQMRTARFRDILNRLNFTKEYLQNL